ncbi:hypothetical protein [Candidatus Poriferisodalis sp.]|uniref:hypothetical protein n=1 Tax=Candidatus Poriferisodalis sp. TaxID=3101277 RepID=UPI003B51B144
MVRREPFEFTTERVWDDTGVLADDAVADLLIVGDVHGDTKNLSDAVGLAIDVRVLRALDLCALIADHDGRGRLVDIRQFCKDWAASEGSRRLEMIADARRPVRWLHRFSARRFDLPRIAAVVDALCDRDDVPAPEWVGSYRARRPVTLAQPRFPATPWNDHVKLAAPPACARHNVWFRPVDLDDYRVHGFR